eukprot:TRINITY_DN47742_c0_g1_i1.p1 TRINITY_DN47742_c0_g1~~TRINITY_DN47742_c0_g1_i1.p1  ORF type:complete len:430 (-),score=55.67 TRINITY_DN47742_c0_g1_i1:22-1311(-)
MPRRSRERSGSCRDRRSRRESRSRRRRSRSDRNGRRKQSKSGRRRRRSPSESSLESACEVGNGDRPGSVRFKIGDMIKSRYRIRKMAGQGTFGTALYVFDEERKEEVAMKVIRSVEKYLDDAEVEIQILSKLAKADRSKNSGVVRLYEHFSTRIRKQKHVCIVFEKLGKSLWDVLEKNNCRGFSMDQVRDFGRQLFTAVAFCHEQKLTHTDLKPENILLCDGVNDSADGRGWCITSTRTRLIDFGGATFEDEHHAKMINTRQYRAPEVMLGLGWSHPSDVWSCGCLLPELLTGNELFRAHKRNLEHFALMEKVLGKPLDRDMARKAHDLFNGGPRRSRSRSASPESSGSDRDRSPSTVPVDRIVSRRGALRWPGRASRDSLELVDQAKPLRQQFNDKHFVDLLEKCLVYDPSRRITAAEALQHPFFTEP